MRLRHRLFMATTILSLSPAGLAGQTATSPIPADSRIRVTTHAGPGLEYVGSLDAWRGDSLEMSGSGLNHQAIPLSDLAKLEISRGRKGHWLVGALIGTGVGLGAGLLATSANNADDPASNDPISGAAGAIAEQTFDVGIVFVSTLAGAGIGALVGALIKTEKWEEVPIPTTVPKGPATVARH